MNSKTIIIILTLAASLTAKASDQKVTITGAKAEAVIASLLFSGVDTKIKGSSRSLQLDELTTAYGVAHHECDDEEVICGFNVPGSIQAASQYGQNIELTEQVQLFWTLSKIVDPIFARQQIQNQDAAMGRLYTEYGKIQCRWNLYYNGTHKVKDATCEFNITVNN